jgi:hypothetical protein
VTEQERFDREALLRRGVAVVGAVYVGPALTSAAAAGNGGCLNFTCSKKKKWKKKHRKKPDLGWRLRLPARDAVPRR